MDHSGLDQSNHHQLLRKNKDSMDAEIIEIKCDVEQLKVGVAQLNTEVQSQSREALMGFIVSIQSDLRFDVEASKSFQSGLNNDLVRLGNNQIFLTESIEALLAGMKTMREDMTYLRETTREDMVGLRGEIALLREETSLLRKETQSSQTEMRWMLLILGVAMMTSYTIRR